MNAVLGLYEGPSNDDCDVGIGARCPWSKGGAPAPVRRSRSVDDARMKARRRTWHVRARGRVVVVHLAEAHCVLSVAERVLRVVETADDAGRAGDVLLGERRHLLGREERVVLWINDRVSGRTEKAERRSEPTSAAPVPDLVLGVPLALVLVRADRLLRERVEDECLVVVRLAVDPRLEVRCETPPSQQTRQTESDDSDDAPPISRWMTELLSKK